MKVNVKVLLALLVAASGCHDDTIKFSLGQRGLVSFAYGFDPIDSVAVAAGGARAQLMVKGAPADAVLRSSDESILTFTRGDDTSWRSFFVYGGEPGRADAILVDGAENELDRVTLEVGRVEQLGVGIWSTPVRVLESAGVGFRVELDGRKKLIGDPAISFAPSEIVTLSTALGGWPYLEAKAAGTERLKLLVDRASYEIPFEVVSPTAVTRIALGTTRNYDGSTMLYAEASDRVGSLWGSSCEWTFSPSEGAELRGTYQPSALNSDDRRSQTTIVLNQPVSATCTIGNQTATIEVRP